MSENSTQQIPVPIPISASVAFNQEVVDLIKGATDTIKTAVRKRFVDEEVNRRADLLARLYIAINTFRKESYKIEADIIAYDSTGKITSKNWTKVQVDKRNKFNEKLSRAESVFQKAIETNEYDKVENTINELKVPDGKSEAKSEQTGKSDTQSE